MSARFRFFWGWTFAMVCSALLNAGLFGLMPKLVQGVPDRPDLLDNVRQVRVIRIKKPDLPPRRKEPEKINNPKKEVARSRQSLPAPDPVNLKPRLSFELNPKLPAAPLDLVMPGLEHFSMAVPALKRHYTMGELDSPLIALVKIPPVYPIRANRRGIEGFVTVEFLVTKQGGVKQISILEADPENVFENSVRHCVSQWKFMPGTVEGIPVDTMAQTTIRFKLEQ